MGATVGSHFGSDAEGENITLTPAPIHRLCDVPISLAESRHLGTVAERLLSEEPALASTDVFGPDVRSGSLDGPALVIGDTREIRLESVQSAEIFEYRSAALAEDGDILLISGNRNEAFEDYRKEILGLGELNVLTLPATGRDGSTPLAKRLVASPKALDVVVKATKSSGGMTIIPHIGTGTAWLLAGELSKRAREPVRIVAPPPRLTRRVNDKVWFAHRVAEILGPQARPAFHAAYGPAALTAQVARLAQVSERIVVKVPDSAGSAGNVALPSEDVCNRTPSQLRHYLISVLRTIGWRGVFPLLVEVWDAPIIANPSVQLWIPDGTRTPPVVEGVYEQVVTGLEGTFVGSVPATLPGRLRETITREACKLARLLQLLGYFGQCSFDAVIAGTDSNDAVVHWIECNGRWGGVSIPMMLANRLTKNREHKTMVVVQLSQLDFEPRPFARVMEILQNDLFKVSDPDDGIVILSPLGLERGCSANLMALAGTVERAKEIAQDATQRLVGKAAVA